MAIRSDRLVVSLISDQGHYTFLYGYTKHNREDGRKGQMNTDLGQLQAQEGEFRDPFCAFFELTRACTRVKLPQKPLAMLTSVDCVLLLLLTALSSRLISFTPFRWLSPSAPFCWMSYSVFSRTFLPSSFRFRGRSRVQALCLGFAPKQRDSLTGTHTHPPTQRMPNIVSHFPVYITFPT